MHEWQYVDLTPTLFWGTRYQVYSRSGDLLYIEDSGNNQRTEFFQLGGTLVAERTRPLTTESPVISYLHSDHRGTPTVKTDSNSVVNYRSRLMPYGAPYDGIWREGPGFTKHATDEVAQLSYMQQRYYDPVSMRFLSPDPIAAGADSFNVYAYANNNPYTFVDPDGRAACPGQSSRSCLRSNNFKQARSGGQNVQASAKTQAAMKAGARTVAVGSGSEEKLAFTAPAGDGTEKATLERNATTGSDGKGFTASAVPPTDATGVVHGHLAESGLVDKAGIGDAGPLKAGGIPNAAVSSDGRRVGVTEVVNGKVQFRMIEGRMTPTEVRLKQQNLNTQQTFFYEDDQ